MGRLEQQIAAVLAALAAHWAPMLAIGQDLFEDFLGIFCCSAMPAISIGTCHWQGREPRVRAGHISLSGRSLPTPEHCFL
jgi:hypothetical protein